MTVWAASVAFILACLENETADGNTVTVGRIVCSEQLKLIQLLLLQQLHSNLQLRSSLRNLPFLQQLLLQWQVLLELLIPALLPQR